MGIRLEVLQFFDNANQSIVERVPEEGSTDIKIGAQLIVQENQEAAFFYEGKVRDVFGPGRHTLSTKNVPILTRLLTIPWEKSPFQAQVYFVGRQTFIDQRWGTSEPIAFRDPELGIVRFARFRQILVPCRGFRRIARHARRHPRQVHHDGDCLLLEGLDCLTTGGKRWPSLKIGLFDLPSQYDKVASAVRTRLADEFAQYGLELVDFFINAITPPEEVQKAIDARSAMGVVGDLGAFMRFQAANSLGKMAEQGGGERSAGRGRWSWLWDDDAWHDPAGDGGAAASRPQMAGGQATVAFGPDFSQLAPSNRVRSEIKPFARWPRRAGYVPC